MIVVDAGPIVALANPRDVNHALCREAFSGAGEQLIVPPTAVAEAAYLLQARAGTGAELKLLNLFTSRFFECGQLEEVDFGRAAELVSTYRSLALGTSDAMVVALAERLGAVKVMTTDRRHFSVVRPRHVGAFNLLP